MHLNRPTLSTKGGILFCLVCLFAISSAKGQNPSESTGLSSPSSFSEKMLHDLTAAMHDRVARNEKAADLAPPKANLAPPKADPGFDRIKRNFLDEILLHKGTSWFTQYLDSGYPIPVELREFQIEGPHPVSVTESEQKIGIKKKVSYQFRSTSFRQFEKKGGWGEWKTGIPASFTGFTMMQKGGIWQITESPAKSYSLLRNK
tara:strand:+ start:383 stop:991 length:609 start_codon:yes stop_codon:yes gene_type:complete